MQGNHYIPKIQHFVKVSIRPGVKVDYYPGLVRAAGTLHVGVKRDALGNIESVYRLDLDSLEPVDDEPTPSLWDRATLFDRFALLAMALALAGWLIALAWASHRRVMRLRQNLCTHATPIYQFNASPVRTNLLWRFAPSPESGYNSLGVAKDL